MLKWMLVCGGLLLAATPFLKLLLDSILSVRAMRQIVVLGGQVIYNRAEDTVEITLQGFHLTRAYGKALRSVRDCTSLDISESTVDSVFIDYISGLARLELLDASGCNIDDSMVDALLKLPSLFSLDLSSTRITEEGARKLYNHPSLRYLYIKHMGLRADYLASGSLLVHH
jgi:hypothetical protein